LIERWVNQTTRISHWRTISKENITSVYGLTANARIANPENPQFVFSWLIEKSWDAKGNLIQFSYKQENSENVANSCYERHRLRHYGLAPQSPRVVNTYLKQISYGNTEMYNPDENNRVDFHFHTIFDYGEHTNNELEENETWAARPDPFSNYKAGFEIRTYRLCQRILMFHNFEEFALSGGSTAIALVRSTDLEYTNNASFSLLEKITHCGYENENRETLPTLEFTYTQAVPATSFKEASGIIPGGIDGQNNEWADLYSEGISGILNMRNDAWYFKPNLEGCRDSGGVVCL